jgi:hypothetical protein
MSFLKYLIPVERELLLAIICNVDAATSRGKLPDLMKNSGKNFDGLLKQKKKCEKYQVIIVLKIL